MTLRFHFDLIVSDSKWVRIKQNVQEKPQEKRKLASGTSACFHCALCWN